MTLQRSLSIAPMLRLFVLSILLLGPRVALAQTPEATRARLNQLQQQLDNDRDRLRRALEAEEVTTATLDALDREVASREALVTTYGMRLEQVRAERDSLSRTLGLLTNSFVGLRARQSALARQAYKHGRLNDLALLFSSKSVSEMVRRAQFLRRITDLRKRHADRMQRSMQALQARQAELTRAERDATKTLSDATLQQQELADSQRRRTVAVDAMRRQRGDLEARIAQAQRDFAALDATLRSVGRDGAAYRRSASPTATAADAEAARTFNALRGRLPWPAEGVVTQGFGNRTDPVLGTQTQHPGIQIATMPGANVAAVFPGTVVRVAQLPGFGTYVALRHGGFVTMYANLSALAVRKDDVVAAGQIVGKAGTDASPRGAGLFFALSPIVGERLPMEDPIPWLAPR